MPQWRVRDVMSMEVVDSTAVRPRRHRPYGRDVQAGRQEPAPGISDPSTQRTPMLAVLP